MDGYRTIIIEYNGQNVTVHAPEIFDAEHAINALNRGPRIRLYVSDIVIIDNMEHIVAECCNRIYDNRDPNSITWYEFTYHGGVRALSRIIECNAMSNDWISATYECRILGTRRHVEVGRNDTDLQRGIVPGVHYGPYYPMPPVTTDQAALDILNSDAVWVVND